MCGCVCVCARTYALLYAHGHTACFLHPLRSHLKFDLLKLAFFSPSAHMYTTISNCVILEKPKQTERATRYQAAHGGRMQTLASPTARGAKCPEVIEKKGWLPAPEKGLATGFGLRLGALIPLIPPTPQNTFNCQLFPSYRGICTQFGICATVKPQQSLPH